MAHRCLQSRASSTGHIAVSNLVPHHPSNARLLQVDANMSLRGLFYGTLSKLLFLDDDQAKFEALCSATMPSCSYALYTCLPYTHVCPIFTRLPYLPHATFPRCSANDFLPSFLSCLLLLPPFLLLSHVICLLFAAGPSPGWPTPSPRPSCLHAPLGLHAPLRPSPPRVHLHANYRRVPAAQCEDGPGWSIQAQPNANSTCVVGLGVGVGVSVSTTLTAILGASSVP